MLLLDLIPTHRFSQWIGMKGNKKFHSASSMKIFPFLLFVYTNVSRPKKSCSVDSYGSKDVDFNHDLICLEVHQPFFPMRPRVCAKNTGHEVQHIVFY